MDGFLLIDKPASPSADNTFAPLRLSGTQNAAGRPTGPTSHDVIDALRKITGIKRVGHAGTLDPFASGLLIVGVGAEATKKLGQFVGLDKTYEAILRLGAVSDTYDRVGKIKQTTDYGLRTIADGRRTTDDGLPHIDEQKIKDVLARFVGEIKQVPPMFSAKKIGGKKLYELARKGKEIAREAKNVTVYELKIINYEWPRLKIITRVSSGTYIRSLAHDFGQALGVGAYLEELRRTAVGPYKIEEAHPLQKITAQNWQQFIKHIA